MLQSEKLVKLKMAGEVKEEEESEREVVDGPSGEAIVHSSGNMPLLPFSH